MAYLDLQNRSPKVELLPDRRQRVTTYADVLNNVPKTPAGLVLAGLWLAWGAAHPDYTTCLLVKQDISGQEGPATTPNAEPPKLVRVYEQIPAAIEVVVGNPSVVVNQYGYLEVTIESLQMASGTQVIGVPGTTAGPAPYSALILRDQSATDDGTLRHIKRVYVGLGFMDQVDQVKFGGKVLIRRLKYLGTVPPTPAGFTLVEQTKFFVNGLTIYDFGFASGTAAGGGGGLISSDTTYRQSPNQGTTGVTVTTINWITDTSVATNPTTGPVGSQLISVSYSDDAGYRLWNVVYASGTGTVSSSVDKREGAKLIIYSITALNAIPSAPAATIGGTVTQTKAEARNGTESTNGTIIYDYQWAEGFGEVDRSVTYNQSSDAGTTGATVTTIKHLTTLGASDPTSAPAGTVKVASVPNAQDGYILWTVTYAKGTGLVVTTNDIRNNGKLVVYRRTALGAAPSAPAATIGGTVVSTGTGYREAEGYKVYDYSWAEGFGVISVSTTSREGGLRLETWVSHGAAYDAAFMLPAGILLLKDSDQGEGFVRWTVTCMQKNDGTTPIAGTAQSFTTKRPFTYPGRAKPITTNVSAIGLSRSAYDIFKSPPVEILVDAVTEITYQTSSTVGSLANTLWNPDIWATIFGKFWGWNAQPETPIIPLTGYRSTDSTPITFNGGNGYEQTCLGLRVFGLTAGTAVFSLQVTGGPAAPDTNTYTLAASCDPVFVGFDGTQYYRKTVVYATIPAQTALPV